MKKIPMFLLSVILFACVSCLAASCGKNEGCNHDYGEWVTEISATCTKEGKRQRICSLCGDVEEDVIGKLPHTLEETKKGFPADCENDGLTSELSCSVCKQVIEKQKTIPALKHKWSKWTYKGDGTHSRVCLNENCGKEEAADCQYGESTFFNVDAKGAPVHEKVCAECGDREYENCRGAVKQVVKPTCKDGGYTVYECEDCHHEYNADYLEVTDEHEWSYRPLSGERHSRDCSVCGKSEEEECAMTHTEIQATCFDDGKSIDECPHCGNRKEEVIPKFNHIFGDFNHDGEEKQEESTHSRKCLRENCGYVETEPCTFTTSQSGEDICSGDVVTVSYCEECKHSYSSSAASVGHDWGSWQPAGTNADGEFIHTRVCNNNPEHVQTETCVFEDEGGGREVSCTESGEALNVCVFCRYENAVEIPALGHSWGAYSIMGYNGGHSRECQRCGEKESSAHDFSETNICPACSFDGLVYEYSPSGNCYKVTKDKNIIEYNFVEMHIPETHDDGVHGELPVREIAENLLFLNDKVKVVYLPHNLTKINSYGLGSSYALEEVRFAEIEGSYPSLTTLSDYAFYGSSKLRFIQEFPTTLKTIGASAFYGCTQLRELTIPDSVEKIGANAFKNTGLAGNPDNLADGGAVYLGKYLIDVTDDFGNGQNNFAYSIRVGTLVVCSEAFSGCKNLVKITIPATVRTIEENAFLDCANLREVNFVGTLDQWVAIQFANNFASPMYYASAFKVVDVSGAFGAVTIKEGVTNIPAGTFRGADISSIVLPSTLTFIGAYAFENSTLEAVTVIDGAKISYVGKEAFGSTPFISDPDSFENGAIILGGALVKVAAEAVKDGSFTVSGDVYSISVKAFAGLTDLKTITIEGSLLKYINEDAFDGVTLTAAYFPPEISKNWMGTLKVSETFGVSRSFDMDNPTYAANCLNGNRGEWRRP